MNESFVPAEFTTIESVFIVGRNVLLLRGNFTPIFTDYYLHLADQHLRLPPTLDPLLKDFMTGLVLHLAARPRQESIAWTVNLRAPRLNLFATGSSIEQSIVGRLFTENVREPDRDIFYSQTFTGEPSGGPRTSTIEIQGRDALAWVEQYYRQSEQHPARSFRLADETYALAVAEPDFDSEWLQAQTAASIQDIDRLEVTKVIETRKFRFNCGCKLDKILPILGSWHERLDELFQGSDRIRLQCPRCAKFYIVTRDMLER